MLSKLDASHSIVHEGKRPARPKHDPCTGSLSAEKRCSPLCEPAQHFRLLRCTFSSTWGNSYCWTCYKPVPLTGAETKTRLSWADLSPDCGICLCCSLISMRGLASFFRWPTTRRHVHFAVSVASMSLKQSLMPSIIAVAANLATTYTSTHISRAIRRSAEADADVPSVCRHVQISRVQNEGMSVLGQVYFTLL